MKVRLFEIPYNFDKNLISIFSLLQPVGQNIYCFYCPTFESDYESVHRDNKSEQILNMQTRYSYESHLNFINEKFPNKIQLLLQRPDIILEKDKVKYYADLGITKFCTSTVQQADIIKEVNPDADIVLSILARTEEKDIEEHPEYKDYFNSIVLWFPFNRDLERIKKLPKDFNYILLANGECTTLCDGLHHWMKAGNTPQVFCPREVQSLQFSTQITIRPQDMLLFDPYIKIWKLQDRAWTTDRILQDFMVYRKDNWQIPFLYYDMQPDASLYTKSNLDVFE